jgi:hypothetical protein
MSFYEAFKCDICGTQRTETNRWFLAITHNYKLDPRTISESADYGFISIRNFDASLAKDSGYTHLCGEACVQRFIAANLAALHPSSTPEPNSSQLPQLITEQELDEAEDVTYAYRVDAELRSSGTWKGDAENA